MRKYIVDDFYCENCGYEGSCQAEKVNEYTDADGNRGMEVIYFTCPECSAEYSH